jgi:hypothetical protein
MRKLILSGILIVAVIRAGAPEPALYKLKATPKTVAWGYYAANTPPALRIRSGDSVQVETLITNSPARLEAAGVPPAEIEPSLREIFQEVTDKGPGGHILAGTIYVEGAESGDTLEVRIRSIQLAIPYAYNTFRPGAGFLPDDFPYARTKIIPLDREKMIAWGSRRRRPWAASAACRLGSTPATSTIRSLWWAPRCISPSNARGALFQVGDVTPAKATAKWILPRSKR